MAPISTAYYYLYRKLHPDPPQCRLQPPSSLATPRPSLAEPSASPKPTFDARSNPFQRRSFTSFTRSRSRSVSPGAPASPNAPILRAPKAPAPPNPDKTPVSENCKHLFTSLKRCCTFRRKRRACQSGAVIILQQRRERQAQKYTVRPADAYLWPDPGRTIQNESRRQDIVDVQGLRKARREADEVDKWFERCKREVGCLGDGVEYSRFDFVKCPGCGKRTCAACRHLPSYRILSTYPLQFASDFPNAPETFCDNDRMTSGPRGAILRARLLEHEEPYAPAYLQKYALRWRAICHTCFPRLPAHSIRMHRGTFTSCRCEVGTKTRNPSVPAREKFCIACWEEHVEKMPRGFENTTCWGSGRGEGCGVDIDWRNGGQRFQAVCNWCNGIMDKGAWEKARKAYRDSEGFERLKAMQKAREEVLARQGKLKGKVDKRGVLSELVGLAGSLPS